MLPAVSLSSARRLHLHTRSNIRREVSIPADGKVHGSSMCRLTARTKKDDDDEPVSVDDVEQEQQGHDPPDDRVWSWEATRT